MFLQSFFQGREASSEGKLRPDLGNTTLFVKR
jgi:hypothetical protein